MREAPDYTYQMRMPMAHTNGASFSPNSSWWHIVRKVQRGRLYKPLKWPFHPPTSTSGESVGLANFSLLSHPDDAVQHTISPTSFRPKGCPSNVPKLLTQFHPRKRSRHGIDRPRNIVQTLAFLSKDLRSRDELQYDLSNKYADGKEDDDR
ncbi:hypothetical protein BDP67DRAFT_486892 [Colletotrichum lupini]|nr:hypothetical protein BDP67DRAFT_486892 [Colletotrichum lupini]